MVGPKVCVLSCDVTTFPVLAFGTSYLDWFPIKVSLLLVFYVNS